MENETKMTAPAPVEYYVGDLCYVMHDEWDEVCALVPYDNSESTFRLKDGRRFFLLSTAYGDGTYFDHEGRSYSVDSGTIGAIKVDDIRDPGFNRIVEGSQGQIIEFPWELEWFTVGADNGSLGFAHITIETGSECPDKLSEDDFIEGEDEDA